MNTQNVLQAGTDFASARNAPANAAAAQELLEDTASDLKARVGRLVESGKAKASALKGGFEQGVRERPIQSILIAAAVGTVIALLLGRRSR